MQIVMLLIATVSEAQTSQLAAYNHFTNVTWKVTDKPRLHWMHMFFHCSPLPGIAHRILVTLVARPEGDMFKTIFEAIWHLLSTTKVVSYFSYNTYKYAGTNLKRNTPLPRNLKYFSTVTSFCISMLLRVVCNYWKYQFSNNMCSHFYNLNTFLGRGGCRERNLENHVI